MKKLSLIATALITTLGISTVSFADCPTIPCARSWLDGFYLGAGIGAAIYNTNWAYTDNHKFKRPDVLLSGSGKNYNLLGRFATGYGKSFHSIYIGGEAWYQYMPYSRNIFDDIQSIAVAFNGLSLKNTFGVAARVGYLPCPNVMLYGLLGASTTSFSYKVNDVRGGIYQFDEWSPGITPGVGIEVAFNNKLSIDARYTYTSYRTISKNLAVSDGVTDQFKITPDINAVMLSLNFRI